MSEYLEVFPTLFICAIACWQAVEIWNHGAIFDRARMKVEAKDNFISDLTSCPWCLSVWVGAFLFLSAFLIPYAWVLSAVLSTSRLSNLANDATHFFGRTPKD